MNINAIKEFAKTTLEDDTTGHDWQHALRVEQNAQNIMPDDLTETQTQIILAACWLHDTIDDKLAAEKRKTPGEIRTFLEQEGATAFQTEEILHIIQHLSYSKNLDSKQELSLLGQIVQDADRLDAIGAIGIARAFYFGGHKGHALYDETAPRNLEALTADNYRKETSVLNHFYEKLLLLKDTMNTEAGQREAVERTHFMKRFLDQFYKEIPEA